MLDTLGSPRWEVSLCNSPPSNKISTNTMEADKRNPWTTLDREWDARFNVQTPEALSILLDAIKLEFTSGKFKYVLVGGMEIGDAPNQNDYQVQHVHCALVYMNRVSRKSILKNLMITEGNGYYLVPRNRNLPYKGWRDHHIKDRTKVDADTKILYEEGTLPQDKPEVSAQVTRRSDDEKKRKLDDIIKEMRSMIEDGKDDEAFQKFPRNFLTYGEKIKSMLHQKRDFFVTQGNPHIWLMGGPGQGKSALMELVYPKHYNKNLDTKFFDLFDPRHHTHTLLQDVDHGSFEGPKCLGVQFFKSICDEAGYPIDQKYKTPQVVRMCILVTSNFSISEVLPEDLKGRRENLVALKRRFFELDVRTLLTFLGIKLLSKYELAQLKKAGNKDPRKLFLAWDYLRDMPTGEDLKDAEHYQQIIRDKYFG